MLNSMFRLQGFNLSQDQVLQDIIRACGRHVSRSGPKVVPWNVDVVLHYLLQAPFEPIAQSLFRHLTQKTVFACFGDGQEGWGTAGPVQPSRPPGH